MSLSELSSADFAPHCGEQFELLPVPYGQPYDPAIHGPPRPLTLLEASDLVTQRVLAPGERRPFSLIFLAPGVRSMPQQTYQVAHATLGSLDIFLVPIALDAAGLRLQAIFS